MNRWREAIFIAPVWFSIGLVLWITANVALTLVATVGRLCRRAERAACGELDITRVTYLFPTLDQLSARQIGFK
jgi:hypothetical protein